MLRLVGKWILVGIGIVSYYIHRWAVLCFVKCHWACLGLRGKIFDTLSLQGSVYSVEMLLCSLGS